MTGPLRVLIVDDSTTDAKLVIQELRLGGRSVEFERVDTASARAACGAVSCDGGRSGMTKSIRRGRAIPEQDSRTRAMTLNR